MQYGDTLLHRAIKQSCEAEVISLLIEEGVSINATDIYGNTPLHIAVRSRYIPKTVIEGLLTSGVKTDIKNKRGNKPWDEAKESSLKPRNPKAFWALNDMRFK